MPSDFGISSARVNGGYTPPVSSETSCQLSSPSRRDREFESRFLQRGVSNEPCGCRGRRTRVGLRVRIRFAPGESQRTLSSWTAQQPDMRPFCRGDLISFIGSGIICPDPEVDIITFALTG
jgi:hypothetical protein